MRGFGCDKSKVVDVMLKGNNEQRRTLITTYKTMYGKVRTFHAGQRC